MRLASGPSACRDPEVFVQWNVQGIRGPQGIQGPAGPPGANGAPGAAGAPGADGAGLTEGTIPGQLLTWEGNSWVAALPTATVRPALLDMDSPSQPNGGSVRLAHALAPGPGVNLVRSVRSSSSRRGVDVTAD
jgi:hypothetical protein